MSGCVGGEGGVDRCPTEGQPVLQLNCYLPINHF